MKHEHHPRSAELTDWVGSDPILRSLPGSRFYLDYASRLDTAYRSALTKPADENDSMVLRHRANKALFVYIVPAGPTQYKTETFDRYGFKGDVTLFDSLADAVRQAVQEDFWHRCDEALSRLSKSIDWVMGTQQKALIREYKAGHISMREMVYSMPVPASQYTATSH